MMDGNLVQDGVVVLVLEESERVIISIWIVDARYVCALIHFFLHWL